MANKKIEKKDDILLSEEDVNYALTFAQALSGYSIYGNAISPVLVNQRMKELNLNPLQATEDTLTKALQNPRDSELALQSFSQDFENQSQIYKKVLDYSGTMIEEADREGKTADDFEHRQNDPVAAAYKREYASQMREAAANKYPRPMYFLPSREEVENLKPGDMAPDAFGNMAEVDHIYHRGEDINGKLFVGYYTKHGAAGGTMSNSMKEDELMRTVATSQKHTSRELDNIEQEMQAARKPKLPAEHQALVAKLVEQTMKAATDIGNKPEMAEYKFYIDRKVEALKANPTTKAAHNVLTDVTKMVETAAKGLKASQVEVETREHFNSHATAPKGRGSWMFSAHKNIDWDKHKHGEDYINTPSLPYKEARAFAKKWAAEKGHKVIHVMP